MNSETNLIEEAADAGRLPALREANRPARASVRFASGNVRFQADAEITPLGLLAVGGMVGTIVVAVASIATAVNRASRRR